MDINIQSPEIVNLNEVCRACLLKMENMKLLLCNNIKENEEMLNLVAKLSAVSNLEIQINDTLPCYLCWSCEEKLKLSYDFQQLCQKSHQFILDCLLATNSVFKYNSCIKTENEVNKLENPKYYTEILDGGNNSKILNENLNLEHQSNFDQLKQSLNNSNEKYFNEYEIKLEESLTMNLDGDLEISKVETFQEIDKKTKTCQTMRLNQFDSKDVENIKERVRKRFLKTVECIFCGFRAKDARALSVHMTRLHKESKENWCLWCNKTFKNIGEHSEIQHKNDLKCPLCGKLSKNTGHFLEHLSSHSTNRKFSCPNCKKTFISLRHLRCHLKTHNNDEFHYTAFENKKKYNALKSFKNNDEESSENMSNIGLKDLKQLKPQNYCLKCNKKVRSLRIHKEKFHSETGGKIDSSKALCTVCGKQFRTISKLTVHLRIHTGDLPYKCSYCDKRTTTRMHLVLHERTHTGDKPHVCNICGKRFAQCSVLSTHLKLHTGRTERCTLCPKTFCRPSELRQHMRRHTGEKPFSCKDCDREFIQKSHLVEHQRTHSDERPYKCLMCEKSFKQAGTLKAHTNIHLGKKPFKCTRCSYSCRQSYSLTQHIQQQHSQDDLDLEQSSVMQSFQ